MPASIAHVVGLSVALVAGGAGLSGLSSGGDPYFPLDGNRGYDVAHYAIHDTYRPGTDRLRGTTVVRASATEDLSRLSLDLVLPVDKVLVDGRPADFSKPNRHEVHVQLPDPVAAGDSFTVTVRYHGSPSTLSAEGMRPNSDLYFHRPGETVAMGEPQNGAWWFAANETPADKATFDITVRVPRGEDVVGNGSLVRHDVHDGWSGWHWRVDEPITTYMAFFAAGRFRLEQGTTDGRPYAYAVSRLLSRDDQRTALRRLRMTGDLVAWLESVLGDYPFGEIGGVIPDVPAGYALEDATRPVYPWYQGSRASWRLLMVHELAHQWFGDDVALRRWEDVWLNEGFATYMEHRWSETHRGQSVSRWLREAYHDNVETSSFWDLVVADPGPNDVFDWPVYERGAMTLAALRNRIGTHVFGHLLRTWAARHRHGHGTTDAFEALAEHRSGQDLTAFFDAWVREPVRPAATAANGL